MRKRCRKRKAIVYCRIQVSWVIDLGDRRRQQIVATAHLERRLCGAHLNGSNDGFWPLSDSAATVAKWPDRKTSAAQLN
jgi:hypothetical protein